MSKLSLLYKLDQVIDVYPDPLNDISLYPSHYENLDKASYIIIFLLCDIRLNEVCNIGIDPICDENPDSVFMYVYV